MKKICNKMIISIMIYIINNKSKTNKMEKQKSPTGDKIIKIAKIIGYIATAIISFITGLNL